MIIRENTIKIKNINNEFMIHKEEIKYLPEDLIFFDLEHYVYKKPKCVGVFGACEFDKKKSALKVTQYMIENRYEAIGILNLSKSYFINMKNKGKKAIVTFSGNNDFTVINYLFEKYKIDYNFEENYDSIDIQKEYEKVRKKSIGLKNLEKQFDIIRESEVISGSNLAKTFHKIMKDKDYIKRMPKDKVEKILLYNEQDVVNLFHIYMNWNKYMDYEEEEIAEIKSIEDIEEEELFTKEKDMSIEKKKSLEEVEIKDSLINIYEDKENIIKK